MKTRDAGDDVVPKLRVRRANLPVLLSGITLGIDILTQRPIVLRLVREDDADVYALAVIACEAAMAATPEPVGAEVVADDAVDMRYVT